MQASSKKTTIELAITTGTVTLLALMQTARPIALAPMAGVSDRPFRTICTELGADYAVTEMIGADPKFRGTERNALRMDLAQTHGPKIVQIAGSDPELLADVACLAVDKGAEVVDINMGCPSKKVCGKLAGSALMKDENLVQRLFSAVTAAVAVPVTVKMRTGWDREHKNAVAIACLAEALGIAALTVHGRTRACRFKGPVEFDTIKQIKSAVSIPVIANGDISTVRQAHAVLQHTQCDGLMIGRAAQGNPWIFDQIKHYLKYGSMKSAPTSEEVIAVMVKHVHAMHAFYGDLAVRLARKHVSSYSDNLPNGHKLREGFNRQNSLSAQINCLEFFANNNNGVLAA